DAVPRYLADTQSQLTESVDVFRDAAADDGEGFVSYLQNELRSAFKDPKVDAAIKTAVAGVQKYLAFVKDELPKKPKASWRTGGKLYEKRFRPYLQTDRPPAGVRHEAETRLKEVRAEMAQLAKKIVPSGDVRAALAKIAEEHTTPAELF